MVKKYQPTTLGGDLEILCEDCGYEGKRSNHSCARTLKKEIKDLRDLVFQLHGINPQIEIKK